MKKCLIILLCILFTLSASGCDLYNNLLKLIPEQELTDEEISKQQQEIINFGFSSSDDEDCIEVVLTTEELCTWENPYGKYSSYILYDKLSFEEQLIYHALEYAMVNSYRYTFIDYRVNVTEGRMQQIAEFLSLDTPLLEQNLICAAYDQVAFYDYQYSEERTVEVLHRGITISIRNFEEELWHKKELAIEEAEKVFANLYSGESDIELAEKLYRYVAESIEYIPYENEYGFYKGSLSPFLYDAFITKKTHCDGFTNALALLFSMAGFEQIEKHGYTDDTGHTWNCVKIDNEWYNCDGTAGDWIPTEDCSMGSGFGFAFEDTLQMALPEHHGMYPDCNTSYYLKTDAVMTSCDSPEFYDAVRSGFAEHNYEWSLVIVEEYNEDSAISQLNRLSYSYEFSIQMSTSEVMKDRTMLIFHKSSLL